MTKQDEQFMLRAIGLAQQGVDSNSGGPFGAVVVKNGGVVAEGCNRVTSDNDPTAHAEIVAIRNACRELNTFQLDGCTVYTSCEPCPMCLAAIYWARPEKIFFAATREDAAEAGFDDEMIYEEIAKGIGERRLPIVNLLRDKALDLFEYWKNKEDKTEY
jgi:guanine deaminase